MGKDQKNNITQDEEFLLTNKKSSKQRKTKKGAAKKREFPVFTVFCVVVGVLLTAFIVQSILKNNGFYDRKKVVMTVGDTTINAVEFSYFYNQTANYYYTLYSQYGLIQESTDITTTQCSFDTTKTWAEWFMDSTVQELHQTLCLYNEAVKNNIAVTDEMKSVKTERYEEIDALCEEYNISRSQYFSTSYMNGFNEKDFERLLDIGLLAEEQREAVVDKYVYTDEQLEEYYEENKKTFDRYTYRSKAFSYTVYEEDSSKTEEENAEAKAAAEESKAAAEKSADEFLASVTDSESFKVAAYELLTEDQQKKQDEEGTDPTLVTDATYSNNERGEWLADEARVEGDKTVIDDTDSKQYVVLYYISAQRLEYDLVNLKHIMINIEDPETEDDATDEEKEAAEQAAKEAAKSKADEVYAKFVDNGSTEEAFSELVADYTNDTNTVQTEGLLENVKKDTYGTEFDEWVFSSDRKSGDCTIIETASAYEVVYYLEKTVPCWEYDAELGKKSDDWQAYIEEIEASYEETYVYNQNNAELSIKS